MAIELASLPAPTHPATLAAIPRYVTTRRAAASGAMWPHKPLALRGDEYAAGMAKLAMALASDRGARLTPGELRALVIARSAQMTALRHGGALPWVPHTEASVRAARKVAGASAIPAIEHGSLVLDPFGFVPSKIDAHGRKILAGGRSTLRALIGASSAPTQPPASYVQAIPALDPATFAQLFGGVAGANGNVLAAAPAAAALGQLVWPAVVLAVGLYAVYKLGGVGERYIDAQTVRQNYAVDTALGSYLARLHKGADPNKPSPLEDAAAKVIEPEGWSRFVGPALAIGVAGVATVAAVKIAREL